MKVLEESNQTVVGEMKMVEGKRLKIEEERHEVQKLLFSY